MRFVLDAIDARWSSRVSGVLQFRCRKACNGVHTNCGTSVFVGERNFEAIGETRKINFQVRMLAGQMLEGFQARFNDRGLQPGDCIAFQTRGVRQVTGYAASRRRQPRIGVNTHVQVFRFSCHGS